jgi:hypothetical protein
MLELRHKAHGSALLDLKVIQLPYNRSAPRRACSGEREMGTLISIGLFRSRNCEKSRCHSESVSYLQWGLGFVSKVFY